MMSRRYILLAGCIFLLHAAGCATTIKTKPTPLASPPNLPFKVHLERKDIDVSRLTYSKHNLGMSPAVNREKNEKMVSERAVERAETMLKVFENTSGMRVGNQPDAPHTMLVSVDRPVVPPMNAGGFILMGMASLFCPPLALIPFPKDISYTADYIVWDQRGDKVLDRMLSGKARADFKGWYIGLGFAHDKAVYRLDDFAISNSVALILNDMYAHSGKLTGQDQRDELLRRQQRAEQKEQQRASQQEWLAWTELRVEIETAFEGGDFETAIAQLREAANNPVIGAEARALAWKIYKSPAWKPHRPTIYVMPFQTDLGPEIGEFLRNSLIFQIIGSGKYTVTDEAGTEDQPSGRLIGLARRSGETYQLIVQMQSPDGSAAGNFKASAGSIDGLEAALKQIVEEILLAE